MLEHAVLQSNIEWDVNESSDKQPLLFKAARAWIHIDFSFIMT